MPLPRHCAFIFSRQAPGVPVTAPTPGAAFGSLATALPPSTAAAVPVAAAAAAAAVAAPAPLPLTAAVTAKDDPGPPELFEKPGVVKERLLLATLQEQIKARAAAPEKLKTTGVAFQAVEDVSVPDCTKSERAGEGGGGKG